MTPQAPVLVDSVGWLATAVFTGSYFFRRPEVLRRAQMLGALMWVAYGLLVHALPVVAANLLVLAAAAWTAGRPTSAEGITERAGPVRFGNRA